MTIRKFCWLLNDAKLGKNDKKWFPKWLRRYAASTQTDSGALPVTEEKVIAFSRELRDNGAPAWQRLQALRAVQAYRDFGSENGRAVIGGWVKNGDGSGC